METFIFQTFLEVLHIKDLNITVWVVTIGSKFKNIFQFHNYPPTTGMK